MSINLENIKLLAFITAYKLIRRNSLLYNGQSQNKISSQLKISPATYRKYTKVLRSKGLITQFNNVERIETFSKCIDVLFRLEGAKRKAFHNVSFFKVNRFSKEISFKAISAQIQKELFKLNIHQQEYRINQIKEGIEAIREPFVEGAKNKIKTACKMLRLSKSDDLLSIPIDSLYAKSGKYHLGKILGCSDSTALNRLRNWHNQNIIKRAMIIKNFDLKVCHASFDYLKGHCHHLMINKNGMYYSIMGSKIEYLPCL